MDRPLIAQFCANDPEVLLTAAKQIEHRVDAVDINLGCPQDIARRGGYGAYLMDDWKLIYSLSSCYPISFTLIFLTLINSSQHPS